jgi:transposase
MTKQMGISCRQCAAVVALGSPQFRDQVEVVAMDGFGGDKTAATEILPDSTAVMDPFYAEFRSRGRRSGTWAMHVSVRT